MKKEPRYQADNCTIGIPISWITKCIRKELKESDTLKEILSLKIDNFLLDYLEKKEFRKLLFSKEMIDELAECILKKLQ